MAQTAAPGRERGRRPAGRDRRGRPGPTRVSPCPRGTGARAAPGRRPMAGGVAPRPKGPKPVLPAPTSGGAGAGTAPGGSAESAATGFEPDPADRVGARRASGLGARIGPETPEDAWMWEGVPPGCGLIRRYEPGERRYYMGDDAGPCIKELPRAWPPGQGPDDMSGERRRVALPVRAPRARRRPGGLAGRPDHHRGRRSRVRRARAALGAQRGGGGGGHRHPGPLRRAGHGAGGRPHGRRVAARGRVLGRTPGRPAGPAAHGRAARHAPAARRLAGHGRGARRRGRAR